MAVMTAELVLVRHGQTQWSLEGRHTGRTDVALTVAGETDAIALREHLDRPFGLILTSPLQRAARTAELAGLVAESAPDLMEWDYGPEEGRTTAQARENRPGWSVWDDSGLGESLEQLASRQRRVLDRVRPVLDGGADVCLIGHGHSLRVLTACWLGLSPGVGQQLVLGAASVSVLGFEHGCPAVLSWNLL
ncbi:MAG: histidine phosphatase family protein [Frankiales bacterium]|nr:histidine phosphatase family protein [Frankiales bacterium]